MARANDKFERRFAVMDKLLAARGLSLNDATPHQMDDAWNEAKRGEQESLFFAEI